ncbi:MAG: hypothetical protein BalsKO_29590 [Balneolaceae bacterium]
MKQKIELFIKICEAVEYAHRNLIIHRDLKPSNIFVSIDGNPKILDFGISGVSAEISDGDSKAYTLKYSSPEQIRGESLSTSSDIYSLGILLFELLADEHPFDLSELDRKQAEEYALGFKGSNPSEVSKNRKLKGDLDAIVMKAIQLESALRYQTVQNLIEDLRRYQDNRPIEAKKVSLMERGLKFIKRNPVSSFLRSTFNSREYSL